MPTDATEWWCTTVIALSLIYLIYNIRRNVQESNRKKHAQEEARRSQQELLAKLEKEQRALQTAREGLAEREAAEKKFRKEIVANGVEEWDKQLRDAGLLTSYLGDVLTVRVYCSPTGLIRLHWLLKKGLSSVPRVVCYRDKFLLFVGRAGQGFWDGRLVRGEEYVFHFEALEGFTNYENSMRFTVTIPTEEEWSREIPGTNKRSAASERQEEIREKVQDIIDEERAWDDARQTGYLYINGRFTDEMARRRAKAALDARIAKEREESD